LYSWRLFVCTTYHDIIKYPLNLLCLCLGKL
jgi:hypothetical protein